MMLSVFNFKPAALLLIAVLTISGCTNDELSLVSALEKQQEKTSYVQSSQISFRLDYWDGDEDFRDSMNRVKQVLDNLSFSVIQKYEGDAKNLKYKAYAETEMALDPITAAAGAWVDIDMNAAEPKYEIIVKIPAIAKAILPAEYRKDYLYIDYFEYLNSLAEEYGSTSGAFTGYTAEAHNLQKHATEILNIMKASPGLSGNYVSSSQAEGDLTKLKLTMSDAQLKKFILAVINEAKTNDELLDKLIEVIISYGQVAEPWIMADYTEDEFRELVLETIDEAIPYMEEYFAENALLGAGGVLLELTLDKDKNIIGQTFSINLRFNSEYNPFYPFGYMYDDESTGSAELTVMAVSEYTNIGEDVNIDFPKLSAGNSVNLAEAIRKDAEESREYRKYAFPYSRYNYPSLSEIGETPVEFPVVGLYNGNEVNTTISIADYDRDLSMPLRQAKELFGGELEWLPEQKAAVWTINSSKLIVFTDENGYSDFYYGDNSFEEFYEEEEFDVSSAVSCIIDGAVYVPISDVEYVLDVDFGFDNETDTILLK